LEAAWLELLQSGNVVYIGNKAAIEQIDVGDKRYSGELISVEFQDIQVNSALWVIAELGKFNVIVLEEASTEKFSLRLKNVPWDQVLDIILIKRRLKRKQRGNILIIGPKETEDGFWRKLQALFR
jgi:type IV pilus assembly protein PilQ